MPRRFFRKFSLKRHHFAGRWYLAPFDHLLHDQRLWGVTRRTIVPAFALGLFVSFMPVPGHVLLAALLALLLRVHIPVAAITTFASNPLTIGPMFYLAYRVGRVLLGLPERPFSVELSIDWLTDSFLNIWQPLMLGAFLCGGLLALIGYITLDALWRASIADYLAKRRARRRRLDARPSPDE
ncbi:MAG: DUF2062 domain-containing protein [Woeseia sp.]